MEPLRDAAPAEGFLEEVRALATGSGAVLVIDEITAGFRLNTGGAHMLFGLEPDIAVFAKAMSNGFPMAAVIGRAEVMEAAQSSFISSTYWTDRVGPAAALATIRKHRRCDVPRHLVRVGTMVQDGWRAAAERTGVAVHVSGMAPLGHFAFTGGRGRAAMTLFTQLMLARGFLANQAFYATFAHQDAHVEAYLEAVEAAFATVGKALIEGDVEARLEGPVAHSGFERLT
jgi:glutamate-1-semialdehyde 2,1-aminomutase